MEIVHAPLYGDLVPWPDAGPQSGKNHSGVFNGYSVVVDEEDIVPDSLIKTPAFTGQVVMIIFMIAGDPVSGFEIVRYIIKKPVVFFDKPEWCDVPGKQQQVPDGLQGFILQKIFIVGHFQV